jgi:Ca2+-binding EF-hand superfamily protein
MNVGSTSSSTLLQQLQQSLFSNADADGDGSLSLSEFESVGQNVQGGGKTTPSGSTDASSLLTSSALNALIALQQHSQAHQTSPSSSTSHGRPSLDDRFAAADANGDGEISADELKADMAKHAPPGAAVAAAANGRDPSAAVLTKLDTDGDGSISKSEFAAMKPHHGGHHHGPPSGVESADASTSSSGSGSTSFDPADTNKDGTVSADELVASLTSAAAKAGSDISTDAMASLTKLLEQLTSNRSSNTAGSSTTSIAA